MCCVQPRQPFEPTHPMEGGVPRSLIFVQERITPNNGAFNSQSTRGKPISSRWNWLRRRLVGTITASQIKQTHPPSRCSLDRPFRSNEFGSLRKRAEKNRPLTAG